MPKSSIISEVQRVTGMNRHLVTRLGLTLTTLASQADNESVSQVASTSSERVAISRFFNNENVNADAILASHARMTEERAESHEVVLFAQDTTEISLPERGDGIGTTNDNKTFGYFIHPLLAMTTDGLPLGCFAHKIWTRNIDRKTGNTRENMLRRTPFEEKESYRWYEGYQTTGEFARRHPGITSVCLADSEADMYNLLAMDRPTPNLHLVVRAFRDRLHVDEDESKEVVRIGDKLLSSPVLGTYKIKARARTTKDKGKRHELHDERDATVEMHACPIRFQRPPLNHNPKKYVSMNAVLVKEVDVPQGETPIEWVLLTTLIVNTYDDAKKVVDYYKKRWQIEIFFRTLKEGCAIEKRRHGSFKSAQTCASLLMIIAWHIMAITYTARQRPKESCLSYFEPNEVNALYAFIDKTQDFPKEMPTLGDFIVKLAALGGYSPKSKYPPGVKVIWKAIRDLILITTCWEQFTAISNGCSPGKG